MRYVFLYRFFCVHYGVGLGFPHRWSGRLKSISRASLAAFTGAVFARWSGRLKTRSIACFDVSTAPFRAFQGILVVALRVSAIFPPTPVARADVFAVHVVKTFLMAHALLVTADLHLFPRYCTPDHNFFPVRERGARIIFFAIPSRSTRLNHFAVGTAIRFHTNHAVFQTAFAVPSTADLNNHILTKCCKKIIYLYYYSAIFIFCKL